MNQAQNQTAAFNLIIEGVGYLNRVREVPVRKADPYLACTVNAMMGTGDDVEYVSIDCKIVGRQAIAAVLQLRVDVDARRKVIVGFRASDPKPELYEFTPKEGQPETRLGLKARLLQLTFAKVNGARVNIPLVPRRPDGAGENGGADGAAKASGSSVDAGSACEDASEANLAQA